MLKTKIISLSLFLMASGIATQAQNKKKNKNNKAAIELTEEQEQAQMLYEDMLPSTAQILVIDSLVTDSVGFIKNIPLNKESGRICTYDEFWGTTGNPDAYVYINEFGNKVFFSNKDNNGHFKLYSADKLGGKWTNVKPIDDFGDEFTDINYPFMMSDGITLYFSAKGKNSLGGYDVYVTRYDYNTAKFYKPENVGLPYNSTNDDYYCMINDFDELGWIVTNRRQNAGKVCVYTFVPSDGRKVYDEDIVDEEKLENLAALTCIQDTWNDKSALNAAKQRFANMKIRNDADTKNPVSFIVNDRTIYTSVNDFKSAQNMERFMQLCKMGTEAKETGKRLEGMRNRYANGTQAIKRQLNADIVKTEKRLEQLEVYMHKLEKEIRNTENLNKE